MAASTTDLITKVSSGTRLAIGKLVALKPAGTLTISCDTLNGWTTDTKVHFVIYNIDTQGKKVAGSQTDWSGIVSGTTITNMVLRAGTDLGYGVGAVVEASPTGAWADDLATGLGVIHNPDGSLKQGVIPATALASSAITLGYSQITTNFTTTSTTAQASGLSVTVTVPAGGRRIKITVYTSLLYNVTANKYSTFEIWDGAVGTGTIVGKGNNFTNAANTGASITAISTATPGAGSKTYNVSLRADSASTAGIEAGSAVPAFILVEAI